MAGVIINPIVLGILLAVIGGGAYFYFFKRDEIFEEKPEASEEEDAGAINEFTMKIKDNMLISPSGEYSCALAVGQINYYLFSEHEREMVDRAFAGFLFSMNRPFQIHVQMHYVDMSQTVEVLKKKAERLPENLQEYAKAYRQDLENWGKTKSVMVRTPLLILTTRSTSMKEAKQQLEHQQKVAQNMLHRCGLDSRPLAEQELSGVLYSIMNKERAPLAPLPSTISLLIKGGGSRERYIPTKAAGRKTKKEA